VVAETSVAGGAVLRHAVEMLAEAVIEALNHAVIRYVITSPSFGLEFAADHQGGATRIAGSSARLAK
jgi:hypothetical protein